MGSVQNKESALGGLQPELLSLIPLVKSCFLTSRPILFQGLYYMAKLIFLEIG